MRDLVDRRLGRITMYRLVTLSLLALALVYVAFTATGVIEGLSTGDNLLALVVVLAASIAANRLVALLWRLTPHDESAAITGLLLFFLFVPLLETSAANLSWLAAAAALANVSKYVLAWRGRHVFNPAAAGALLVVVAQDLAGREAPINAIWQTAATKPLLPFVAVAALLVLTRTRRLDVGLTYTVLAYVLVLVGLTQGFGTPLSEAWQTALYSFPIVFIAGFMVTEPLTLPPRRWQQLTVAVATALLSAYPVLASVVDAEPLTFGVYSVTPEVAILLGNLVAFALARRSGVTLMLDERVEHGDDTHELVFTARRPVRFTPGQYVELHLPHRGADGRGVRRVFSIASAPSTGPVSLALRIPADRASSFKRAVTSLAPGDTVQATGVGGDFVLPRSASTPVALVAGGIGITPFLSQLAAHPDRDAVLVYAVPGVDVPFRDRLSECRVVLVSPTRPTDLPERWTHVASTLVTADVVAAAVPDLADRHTYVSGPPAMVNAVRAGLRRRTRSVHTDYFSGY